MKQFLEKLKQVISRVTVVEKNEINKTKLF